MNIQDLINYFAHIRTGEIKVKNWLPTVVFFILIPTFAIILVVFLGLFIGQVPLDTDNGVLNPGDPTYVQTFYLIIGILGAVTAIQLIAVIISIATKPKPWVMWTVDYDRNIICHETTRKHERLIGPNFLIDYNRLTGSVYYTKSIDEARALLHKTLFWTALNSKDQVKIKSYAKKIVLTIDEPAVRERRVYSIGFDFNDIVQWYSELVYSSVSGGSNIKSFRKCHIENQNRSVKMDIHPAIRKIMTDNNIYIMN